MPAREILPIRTPIGATGRARIQILPATNSIAPPRALCSGRPSCGGGSGSPAPAIDWFSIAYLPKNIPPEVTAIALQDPGVRVKGISLPTAGTGPQAPAQLRMPQPPPSASSANAAFTITSVSSLGPPAGSAHFDPVPQGMSQKGYQSVLWTADDANDDQLEFAIYFRGENETSWKLLKDKLDTRFYSWDTTSMPDGAYYLKIVASDAPSNPTGEGLSSERESDRFVVDNTPPSIAQLTAESVKRRRACAISGQRSGELHRARAIQSGCGRLDAGLPGGRPERRASRELRFSVAEDFAGRAHGHSSRLRPV